MNNNDDIISSSYTPQKLVAAVEEEEYLAAFQVLGTSATTSIVLSFPPYNKKGITMIPMDINNISRFGNHFKSISI